jgi:hypothetical protein
VWYEVRNFHGGNLKISKYENVKMKSED